MTVGIRKCVGKGASRLSRRNSKIPGVIYGNKKNPVAIELDSKEWLKLLQHPGLYTKQFNIKTDEGSETAMLADIQYHPVSDNPLHVDFVRIDVNKEITVSVPLVLINEETCAGIKMGGNLNFLVRDLEIIAKIADVPEKIEIDIADLNIGDVIHGEDIKLPKGAKLESGMDSLAFVTIVGREEEAKTAEATATATPATTTAKPAAAKPADKK